MKVNKVKLSYYQVERLFEEFNKKLFIDGINPTYSYFLFKNSEYLSIGYNKLRSEMYDERTEPDYPAMMAEQQQLIAKYADRNEQGNIIKDQYGNATINENIVEFNNENDKLMEKYKDLFEKIKNKPRINHELLSQEAEYDLITLELSEFPNSTPPFIVGLLSY